MNLFTNRLAGVLITDIQYSKYSKTVIENKLIMISGLQQSEFLSH